MLQSFHEDTTAEQITQMLPYNYRKKAIRLILDGYHKSPYHDVHVLGLLGMHLFGIGVFSLCLYSFTDIACIRLQSIGNQHLKLK